MTIDKIKPPASDVTVEHKQNQANHPQPNACRAISAKQHRAEQERLDRYGRFGRR